MEEVCQTPPSTEDVEAKGLVQPQLSPKRQHEPLALFLRRCADGDVSTSTCARVVLLLGHHQVVCRDGLTVLVATTDAAICFSATCRWHIVN